MRYSLSSADKYSLVACFLVALIVRGAVITLWSERLEADSDGYRQLAENVREHGVYGFFDGQELLPTAFRPPLYPLLLTMVTSRQGELPLGRVAVLHALLGACTVLGVWVAARCSGLKTTAWLAAAFALFDPLMLNQSPQVMTETLAAALAIASCLAFLYAERNAKTGNWWIAGTMLGLAALCRPTFLAVAVFSVLALAMRAVRQKSANQAIAAASVLLAVLLVHTPWLLRNSLVLGRPVFATTHGGYTALLGNNADFFAYLRSPDRAKQVWKAERLDQQLSELKTKHQWTELEYDAWTAREARRQIQDDPRGFLHAAAYRVIRLWSVLPRQVDPQESRSRQWMRYAIAVWYSGVLASALLGIVRPAPSSPSRRSAARFWIGLFALSVSMLHMVYWCDMRMRTPLSPLLAVAAAWTLADLASRLLDRGAAETISNAEK